MNTRKSQDGFTFVALAVALAVLIASVLAIAPHLHQRLHGASPHECVVTLIATGKYDHSIPAASSVAPDCLRPRPVALPKVFQIATATLEFSLLEHAPPALS